MAHARSSRSAQKGEPTDSAAGRVDPPQRDQESRSQLVLESIKDQAIFVLDDQGRIVTWPAGAQQVFGYPAAEALGQTVGLLYPSSERAEGLPEAGLARSRATGSVSEAGWHVRRDGTQFWGEGTLSVLVNADGEAEGFVKVLRDHTAQKQLAEDLRQARSDAKAANAAKDYFLVKVSHDLRTPLTPMLLWTQILGQEKGMDAALLNEGLEMIRKCAEEQHALVEDLLDTSRIISGKLRLELEPADLVQIGHAAVDLARPAAALKGVILDVFLDPQAGTVLADGRRLQQAIGHLLENAVKFTPDGGQVSLQLRRAGDTIEIRISDNGVGIDAEFLPRIFTRLGQPEDSATRGAGGLGLGLAIARQLVELHHGTLIAHSEGANRGATFVITLPLPVG